MVRQFDVCANSDPDTRDTHPYFVVLQSDLVGLTHTRIVAPLISPKRIQFFERLLPEVPVKGSRYVIAIPDLGAIPAAQLKSPVANLEEYRYQIIAALDLVFTGI